MTLMKESFILIGICLADLFFTVFLLGSHRAAEGNPVMSYYLKYGLGTFVMMKIMLFALPIFIAEWSKRYRPRFVKRMLRFAILAYVGAYVLLFLSVNVPALADNHADPTPPAAHTTMPR